MPQLKNNLSYKSSEKRKGVLGTLEGICADCIHATRNGRLYPNSVWEVAFNDPIVQEHFKAGGIFGQLGHPKEGQTENEEFNSIAICMPEPPKKRSDGKLVGRWDILDTPNGRILKCLCDYGYKIGISSRAEGDVDTDWDGNESVQPEGFEFKAFDAVLLPAVKEARLNLIKQTGILEYKEPSGCLEQMGGNEAFKKWIEEIKYTFTPEAEEFGVQKSKGYLALGIPGTSKSVSAEITANLLHLPLLEFKMQNIMNSLVGKSEQNMADAVKIIKSCSPCVLFIDEVEKSLSGNSSSDKTDGGTLSRVLGQLLTFLASDDSKNVFTIMTSNDVSKLPPELTRSGRLDVIWYFGLPNELERKEIFNIYLKDTKLDINDNLLNYAVKETNSYTGAEIKQIVNVLVRRLFFKIKEKNDSTIDKEDILLAIKEVIPVAISSREKILALDTYCKNRARYASEIEDQVEEYD